MKSIKIKKIIAVFLFTLTINLTFSQSLLMAQTTDLKVNVRPDPANPKRKIIELPRVQQKVQVIRLKQNILDMPQFKRPAIPFQKFEMVSPSGKPLDPNKIISLPDGRKITVKEFYDQSNKVEESLNQRGYSLRTAGTFDNINLSISNRTLTGAMIPDGAKKITQAEFNNLKNGMTSNVGKPFANMTVGKINTGAVKNILPGSVGKLFASDSQQTRGFGDTTTASWYSNSTDCGGGSNCQLLIEMPKGSEKNYGKLVWQVSAVPFESNINPLQAPNIVKVGIMKTEWSFTLQKSQIDGATPNNTDKSSYMQFPLDFAAFLPPNTKGKYYVRAVLTDQNNSNPGVTPSIALVVNTTPISFGTIEIPQTTAPSIYKQPNQNFPSEDSPFGFYFNKNNLSGTKTTFQGKTTGYKINGGAELGVRYYNFKHLLNSGEPKSYEQSLLGAQFDAVLGSRTGAGGANETQGARLTLSILGQETVIPLTDQETIPTGEYSLNYGPKSEQIDNQLVNIVIPLIPIVNIVIEAKITGSYGYQLTGKVNFMDNSAGGNLRLFVNTDFNSKAGLEIPLGIAYVGMKGTSLPLFNAEINSSFNSDGKGTVKQIGSYKALVIDVSLTAGFYHPCPPVKQIKKLWGYITGDEDTPLCQTDWNYNIFKNNGYEDAWVIDGK